LKGQYQGFENTEIAVFTHNSADLYLK